MRCRSRELSVAAQTTDIEGTAGRAEVVRVVRVLFLEVVLQRARGPGQVQPAQCRRRTDTALCQHILGVQVVRYAVRVRAYCRRLCLELA